MTLYELTGQFLELLEMAEDTEIDVETLQDTMEGLEFEVEEKADGYAKIIKQLTAEADVLKAEADAVKAEAARILNRKIVLDNKIDRMKRNLENTMIATGKTKFKTQLFSFNIQKNTPSLEVLDETKVPKEYFVVQEPKLDRKKLLAYIKENPVDYATVKQTESLRIR